MIRSQARHLKDQTPIKNQIKNKRRQQNLSGKQNLNKSPCSQYHDNRLICGSNDNISEQNNEFNQIFDINVEQFNCNKEESQKLKKIQNIIQKNRQNFYKNKTQGCQQPIIQYPKIKKLQKQHKIQHNQFTNPPIQQSPKNNNTQLKIKQTPFQNEQQTIINNTIMEYHIKKQQQNYEKRQIKSRKIKQKKAGFKIQQKNIDVMNKQIHSLLDFFKQGKNYHQTHKIYNDNYLNKYQCQPPTPRLYGYANQTSESDDLSSSISYKHLPKRDILPSQNQLLFKQQLNNISYRNNPKQPIDMMQQSLIFHNLTKNQLIKQQPQAHKNLQNNLLTKQKSNINLIDNKIVKIKQRIQLSQEATRLLGNKYLGNKQQYKNYPSKTNSHSIKNIQQLSIIKKIDQLKRDLHKKQPQTQKFIKDNSFQQDNTQEYLNNKYQSCDKQQYPKLSINIKYDKENQSNKFDPYTQNSIKVGYSNKYNDKTKKNILNISQQFNKHNWNEVVNKLIQVLDQQIKIDQQLLQHRQMFHNLPVIVTSPKFSNNNSNSNNDKWEVLIKKISETSLIKAYQHQQLKKLIQVNAGEGNPFWQPSNQSKPNQQIIINTLIQFLEKSENHWNKNIVGFITKAQMIESCFSITILDLNKLGYISVQDLVCFVNLHTKNLYRNRDLLTIFKRLCLANDLNYQQNKITYQQVQNVIVIQSQYSSFNN